MSNPTNLKEGALSIAEVGALLRSTPSPTIGKGQLAINVKGGVVHFDGERLKVHGEIKPEDKVFFLFGTEKRTLKAMTPGYGSLVWHARADSPLEYFFEPDVEDDEEEDDLYDLLFEDEVEYSDDPVEHPSHYADGWSNGAEVIDITEHLSFNRGNVVKYVARAGKKDPAKELEDLSKALFYLRREITLLGGDPE